MSKDAMGSNDANFMREGETMDSSEERMWGTFCHLSGFVGYIVPFGNIIAPLVIWLVKKEESQFVDYHGKESP